MQQTCDLPAGRESLHVDHPGWFVYGDNFFMSIKTKSINFLKTIFCGRHTRDFPAISATEIPHPK